jgi:hypothetical protein
MFNDPDDRIPPSMEAEASDYVDQLNAGRMFIYRLMNGVFVGVLSATDGVRDAIESIYPGGWGEFDALSKFSDIDVINQLMAVTVMGAIDEMAPDDVISNINCIMGDDTGWAQFRQTLIDHPY